MLLATDILTKTDYLLSGSSDEELTTGEIIFSMFSSRLKISSKGLFMVLCFLN